VPVCKPSPLVKFSVYVKNHSKSAFDMDYLVIYPETMNVYEHNGELFSDPLYAEFTGTNLKTEIHRLNTPNYHLITAGIKNDLGDIIARRSIDIIRDITRF
jgi:hypothetical protein